MTVCQLFMVQYDLTTVYGGTMSSARRISISFIAAVGILLGWVGFASGESGGRPFTTYLTGAAEVTAAGVPDQGTWTAAAPQV
jgi:hypothetical protein